MSSKAARRRPAPKRTPPRRGRPRRRLANLWVIVGLVAVVVAGLVTAIVVANGGGSSSSGPSQAPQLLAAVDSSAAGQPVDGIQCQTMEQLAYHVHAHLAVYAGGEPRTIPAGIGIAPPRQTETQSDGTPFVLGGACIYWLHSHTQDGIIHIESPTAQQTFTLGQYFDIWGQPLSATQVGPVSGALTAYVNGQRYTGNPRDIPLTPHALIQLDVGVDVAPQPFSFPSGL